jgi:DNA-3-methyladenine glycosylase II
VYGRDRASLWLDGGIHRVFGGREVRIEAAPGGVEVSPHDAAIEAAVLRFLGLPFDLGGFYAWAQGDELLGWLANALAGFRPPLQPDPFEALVTSITAQQVSLQSAAAIRSRFIERFGVPGVHAHAFPERERVARATEEELMAVGFSTRKAEYVVGLARSELGLDELATLPDEEVTARLVALRGLGQWTADWFLARHLARPHAWPAGDLGVRKAVTAFYGDVPDVRAFASRFHPFENLSAHYLLTGLRLYPPA